MDEVIKQIDGIVNWWLNLKKGYQNMDHLDEVHRKLTALNYFLADEIKDKYDGYSIAKIERRIGVSTTETHIYENQEKKNFNLASSQAKISEKDYFIEEAQRESDYLYLKHKVLAISKVIESIKQRVSNLKTEIKSKPYT